MYPLKYSNYNYLSTSSMKCKIWIVEFTVVETKCKSGLQKGLNITLKDSAVKNKIQSLLRKVLVVLSARNLVWIVQENPSCLFLLPQMPMWDYHREKGVARWVLGLSLCVCPETFCMCQNSPLIRVCLQTGRKRVLFKMVEKGKKENKKKLKCSLSKTLVIERSFFLHTPKP